MPPVDREELGRFVKCITLEGIDSPECMAQSFIEPKTIRSGSPDPDESSTTPSFELQIQTPDQDPFDWFSVRVRVSAVFPEGQAAVAARAIYSHRQAERPSIELLTAFTNEVALMALLPYLRESLADVTRRVFGPPLTMPMFQRGQLQFDVATMRHTDEPSA